MSHAIAVHPNSTLTPTGRLQMVQRHLQDHSPIAHVASEFRVSWDTVNKWVTRYQQDGEAALTDVSSAPVLGVSGFDGGVVSVVDEEGFSREALI